MERLVSNWRSLLATVVGAHAVLKRARLHPQNIRGSLSSAFRIVAIALANKMARIAGALLAKGETYRVPRLAAA